MKNNKYYVVEKATSFLLSRNIIRDSVDLVKHFYGNTASITSKLPGVILKHVADIYLFYTSPLSKDANPTVSNIIREGMNLGPNSLNAYLGVKHTENSHELQDVTHMLGQGARLGCKIGFQVVANEANYSSVYMSRASNIACDSLGVMGQKLSKLSQPKDVSERLYYLWQGSNIEKNIYGFTFLKEKITPGYVLENILTAGFKAGALDQVGETIKLVSQSSPVLSVYNITENIKNNVVAYSSDLPLELINTQYTNVYLQREAIFAETNNSTSGYIANFMLEGYQLSRKIIVDLYVTGPMLLSCSNDAVKYYSSLSGIDSAVNMGAIGVAAWYKNEIFSYISNISPELLTSAAVMTLSNDLYDMIAQSHPGVKAALVGTAFAYSHYKQDILEYFSTQDNIALSGVDNLDL